MPKLKKSGVTRWGWTTGMYLAMGTAYAKISKAFTPYITWENLIMFKHNWSTHKNKAMNKSIFSCASKDKIYCTTASLITRVEIAGEVQVEGITGSRIEYRTKN